MKIVVLVILAVLLACVNFAAADYSGQLWNKYRVQLINLFEPMWNAKKIKNVQGTIFSLVTTPEEAEWIDNRNHLQEYFSKWPVTFNSRFSHVGNTADRTLPALYKKALLTCKAAKEYVAFSKAKLDTVNGKPSYPWVEVGETLKSFVDKARAGKARKVHFIVQEKKGSTTTPKSWGRSTGTITGAGSFLRQLIARKTQSDDELENLESMAESSLFWRRRRRPPPPKPVTIHVKSEKFNMDFKSDGITGVEVRPGNWLNKSWIRANKQCLNAMIKPGGLLSAIPRVIWLAYRPHITLKLSASEYHKVQSIWQNKKTLGMSVGGSLFRSSRYRKSLLEDSQAFAALPEDHQKLYMDDDMSAMHEDSVEFKEIMVEKKSDDEVEEQKDDEVIFSVANVPKSDDEFKDSVSFNTATKVRLAEDEEVEDDMELISSNEESMSDSTLWRRRRRRRPPPPPPPKKVYEKVYTVTFKSNSPFPEILAVTSERVDSF